MSESLAVDTGSLAVDPGPMDKEWFLQAILDLEHDRDHQVTDPDIAYDLGYHLKPYIDRLSEDTDASEGTQGKRRRKASNKQTSPPSKGPIIELPPAEQARWIFMDRFIPLERHEKILGCSYPEDDFEAYTKDLERVITDLSQVPRVALALATGEVEDLQKMFASFILLFRSPYLGDNIPINLNELRQQFPDYFYKKRKTWYDNLDFSSASFTTPHWAICDTEYLNCTLRKPNRKLDLFGRAWDFPPDCVRLKEVTEDVYDRIISGEALGEDLFARNYNSCTATTYQHGKKSEDRLVYTIQRDHQITIHGKRGIPHWKASRRLWPGVVPTVVF